jgi:hypothetical protein
VRATVPPIRMSSAVLTTRRSAVVPPIKLSRPLPSTSRSCRSTKGGFELGDARNAHRWGGRMALVHGGRNH